MEMSIPVCGKFRCKFDTKDYDTCDGHRMLAQAEEDLIDILKKEIWEAVKMSFESLVSQFVDTIHDTGCWPLERAIIMIPRMYQNEDSFTDWNRNTLVDFDNERLNSIAAELIDSRPHNYKKYLTEGKNE